MRAPRDDSRVFWAILALWVFIIVAAWSIVGFKVAHSAPAKKLNPKPPEVSQCIPIPDAWWERLRASGLEHEIVTEAAAVLRIANALREVAECSSANRSASASSLTRSCAPR